MKFFRWVALLLAVVMLFTGCSGKSFEELMTELLTPKVTAFSEMEYTRPEPEKMEAELQKCLTMAQTEQDKDALIEQAWAVYLLYNEFYTNHNLVTIYYFQDMTNTKWEEEYNFCSQHVADVNAMLDEMFYALADSPLREQLEADPAFGEGFFDAYEGESLWDKELLEMMEQEAQLEESYLKLCTQAQDLEDYSAEYFDTYANQMADVYVKLVKVRQEMAKHAGYEDYPSFAYDFYHTRDYKPQQAEKYLLDIQAQLVPLYRQLDVIGSNKQSSQEQTLAYLESSANAMGGWVQSAFQAMKDAGLYDISYSDKKFAGSFETYLSTYASPFVFVNPTGYEGDKLTFSHEFGHFCADFIAGGSPVEVDVAEVFSQGMEYLTLCYGDEAGMLTRQKMQSSLCVYVEQACLAYFEQQVYALGAEELTTENVFALYEQIGSQFGFDTWGWDSRDFVTVSHLFTEPMYVISYVVSNDVAMQLYQMEQKETGSGLTLYQKQLTTQQTQILGFVQEAGLESPFADGRVAEVKATLEKALG